MRSECLPTNGKRGGLASTSPQPAETAGGESCSFSGFNHHHDDEEDIDEDENENDDDDEEEGELDDDFPDPPSPLCQ